MKRILFLLSFFYAFQFQAQEVDWYSIPLPSDVVSSNNYQYEVDDQGFVYCINAFGTTLRISQYDALSHTWNIISDENLTAPADQIKVDKRDGIIFFSFVSEQVPTPLINLYTIENGTVNLKIPEIQCQLLCLWPIRLPGFRLKRVLLVYAARQRYGFYAFFLEPGNRQY